MQKDMTLNEKTNSKKRILPILVLVAVLIAWGFDFIGIEYMMKYMPSGVYTMMRLTIGSLMLLIASFIKNGGLHVSKKDWPRLFICGVAAMSLYLTIEGIGIQMTSASFGSLILSTVPIFGMIGDRIFFKRKITPLKIVCIVISILGVYLLVAGDLTNSKIAGLFVILIAAMIWAFQIAYMKPL